MRYEIFLSNASGTLAFLSSLLYDRICLILFDSFAFLFLMFLK